PARCPPRTGSYPATATSPSTASSAGCSTPATAACSSSNWSARASRRRATGARWRAAATHSQGCSSADERRPSAGPPSQLIHLADGDELDLSPDALVAFELGEQVGLADLRVTACAGAEIAHGKAPLRVAVAIVAGTVWESTIDRGVSRGCAARSSGRGARSGGTVEYTP